MRKILSVLLAMLLVILQISPAWAQVTTQTEQTPIGEIEVPDWQKTTFGSLPPLTERGEIQDLAKAENIKLKKKHAKKIEQILGYNPARAWEAGSPVSEVFKLGDFEEFGLTEKSLDELTQGTSVDIDSLALSSLGTADEQTIKSLTDAIPELNSVKVGDVPIFKELLINAANKPTLPELYDRYESKISPALEKIDPILKDLPLRELLDKDLDGAIDKASLEALKKLEKINPLLKNIPVSDILKGDFKQAADKAVKAGLNIAVSKFLGDNPTAGNIPLGANADLAKFAINSIPGLKNTPVGNIKGLKNESIAKVPGVKELPLSEVLNLKDLLKIRFAKVDLTLGEKERQAVQPISGSTKGDKFKPEPCLDGAKGVRNCAHIELADNVSIPGLSVKGRQWIAGASQTVKGGKGLLQIVNGGNEPTGVTVFGDKPNIKVVINNIDEAKGRADLQIYFRVCVKIFFTKHCTPYFIGPIPFGSVSEKGLILVASSKAPSIDIPPSIQGQINAIAGKYEPSNQASCAISVPDTNHGHIKYEEAPRDDLISVGSYRGLRTEYMRKDAGTRYLEMVAAAERAGIYLIPISGFRSIDDQRGLWTNQVQRRGSESEAAKYSAPPGYSEHHTGLTLDIGARDQQGADLSTSFENTPSYRWLQTNAGSFGFELSFPRGNSQGVSFEPWHWRYKAGQTFSAVKSGSSSKSNLDLYLERIRVGESDDCRNIGPNASTGAYGCYQFTPSTRALLMARYPQYDPWSTDRAIADNAAIKWIELYGKEKRINILGLIKQGRFGEADEILGRAQFTSLPGGAEESVKWQNTVLIAKYSPGGTGTSLGCGGTPYEPGKPCTFANPLPKGYLNYSFNEFGACRSGCSRQHEGIDLQTAKGAQNWQSGPGESILAADDGQIEEYVPVGGRCGGVISIWHPQRKIETRYLHMVKLDVSRGSTVKRGQPIGVEGNEIPDICSGGTHLHLETRPNRGAGVNPASFDYDPPMPKRPRF